MEFEELTRKIIGCAFNVYNQLGFGFLESFCEKCMVIELAREGLYVQSQQPIPVRYNRIPVGDFIADLVVEDTVIVELKSVKNLSTAHEVQLVNYLTTTARPIGLLLNFGDEKVEIKRQARTLAKE